MVEINGFKITTFHRTDASGRKVEFFFREMSRILGTNAVGLTKYTDNLVHGNVAGKG